MVENAIDPSRANAMPGLLALISLEWCHRDGPQPYRSEFGAPIGRPTGWSSSWPSDGDVEW